VRQPTRVDTPALPSAPSATERTFDAVTVLNTLSNGGSRQRSTARQFAIAGTLVAVAAILLIAVTTRRGLFDLKIYYGGINAWLRDGEDLYRHLVQPNSGGGEWGFTYPPFAALSMSPMALVDWGTAVAISTILSVLSAGMLVYLLVDPISRRHGWPRWYAFALAAFAAAMCDPVASTIAFGQVNLILVLLVVIDAELLRTGRYRFVGVGIGLAAAIKLTPVIFVLYLLIAGHRRATLIAATTAAGATVLAAAAAVAPQASWMFWTQTLWHTDRVGAPALVSNQSLHGMLSRVSPGLGGWWWVLAAIVLAVWAVRVRRAAVLGCHQVGFALTGVVGCLVSPISWTHHLVWLLPALVVLTDTGLRRPRGAKRSRLLHAAALAYFVLCSRIIWLWSRDWTGFDGLICSNAYIWVSVALLAMLPIEPPASVVGVGSS
jgi:alpha-1,2-mannosyltransferase